MRDNPSRAGMIDDKILERIENWRRFYRPTQRVIAVWYYTPPESGEVMQNERFVRMPVNMQDAIRLELSWRNLTSLPKKNFIKYEYILKLPQHIIWRKLKKDGVVIKNSLEHLIFNRSALETFSRVIG